MQKAAKSTRRLSYCVRRFVAQWLFKQIGFESRKTKRGTNQIGYENGNRQVCLGTRGMRGSDHNAFAYAVFCLNCGKVYGANGGDIQGAGGGKGRQCPKCQGGDGEDLPF